MNLKIKMLYYPPVCRKGLGRTHYFHFCSLYTALLWIKGLKALVKAADYLKVERLFIITYDQETTLKEKEFVIEVIPIWKWLLQIAD